jgi:hypothetical protein
VVVVVVVVVVVIVFVLEIRVDTLKLVRTTTRPFCARAEDIGEWL